MFMGACAINRFPMSRVSVLPTIGAPLINNIRAHCKCKRNAIIPDIDPISSNKNGDKITPMLNSLNWSKCRAWLNCRTVGATHTRRCVIGFATNFRRQSFRLPVASHHGLRARCALCQTRHEDCVLHKEQQTAWTKNCQARTTRFVLQACSMLLV